MPWDAEQEQVERVYVCVPTGLKSQGLRTRASKGTEPHRIVQFFIGHGQEERRVLTNGAAGRQGNQLGDSWIEKKSVVFQVPPGVPAGSYVPVDLSTQDLKNPSVKVVRGTVPRVIRHDAQVQVNRDARAYGLTGNREKYWDLFETNVSMYIAVRHNREDDKSVPTWEHQVPLRYGQIIQISPDAVESHGRQNHETMVFQVFGFHGLTMVFLE